jgi:hypothetical protein
MRCNILCCGWAAKTASQQLRHGFLYPRALLLLLDPRAQMKPPPLPFNLCANERISPGFSTNSVNKSQGKRVSFCCCCACCNLIVCHKLLGRPFTEKEENELSRTRRRWRPKEMVLG